MKSVRVIIHLTEEEAKALIELAQRERRSNADQAAYLIQRALEAQKNPPQQTFTLPYITSPVTIPSVGSGSGVKYG